MDRSRVFWLEFRSLMRDVMYRVKTTFRTFFQSMLSKNFKMTTTKMKVGLFENNLRSWIKPDAP